jgi:uncharacterized protein YdeI (YjbR/CyaY-like superfamily)
MGTPTFFDSAADFRAWLERNHATEAELLVGFRKVGTGSPNMTWPESVDEALCFGWIDGVTRRIDGSTYSVRFTPRRPNSIWSAVNLRKVEALVAEGRMRPAGLRVYEARNPAKEKVYSFEQEHPAELDAHELAALKARPATWAYFESTPPGYRKTVIHWITTAKQPATRTKRFASFLQACSEGRRLK